MLINDEPSNKKFDFKVLDIALWYQIVICRLTGWGGGRIFYTKITCDCAWDTVD